MANIFYTSDSFRPHLGQRFVGRQVLSATWSELVWAAITAGKASIADLFRFGRYSRLEAIFRAYMLYANLKEGNNYQYQSTRLYRNLDPSEKGAISYFLGITLAKLFASQLLSVPWLMHLDVYRTRLLPGLAPGKSKPDLVGLTQRDQWVVMEAKGRSGSLSTQVLVRAKNQTRRLRRIAGTFPSYRIAFASYFQSTNLRVRWKDPDGNDEDAKDLEDIDTKRLFLAYYEPFKHLFGEQNPRELRLGENTYLVIDIPEMDLVLGLLAEIMATEDPVSIKGTIEKSQSRHERELAGNLTLGSDGVLVQLGKTWSAPNMSREPFDREL